MNYIPINNQLMFPNFPTPGIVTEVCKKGLFEMFPIATVRYEAGHSVYPVERIADLIERNLITIQS